jgi:hypothetical protein
VPLLKVKPTTQVAPPLRADGRPEPALALVDVDGGVNLYAGDVAAARRVLESSRPPTKSWRRRRLEPREVEMARACVASDARAALHAHSNGGQGGSSSDGSSHGQGGSRSGDDAAAAFKAALAEAAEADLSGSSGGGSSSSSSSISSGEVVSLRSPSRLSIWRDARKERASRRKLRREASDRSEASSEPTNSRSLSRLRGSLAAIRSATAFRQRGRPPPSPAPAAAMLKRHSGGSTASEVDGTDDGNSEDSNGEGVGDGELLFPAGGSAANDADAVTDAEFDAAAAAVEAAYAAAVREDDDAAREAAREANGAVAAAEVPAAQAAAVDADAAAADPTGAPPESAHPEGAPPAEPEAAAAAVRAVAAADEAAAPPSSKPASSKPASRTSSRPGSRPSSRSSQPSSSRSSSRSSSGSRPRPKPSNGEAAPREATARKTPERKSRDSTLKAEQV